MSEPAADSFVPDLEGSQLPKGFEVLAEDENLAAEIVTALADVEDRLMEALSSPDDLVNTSARYLAEAGGKRVRPLLTILASLLGEGPDHRVKEAAAVMEMTQVATLYHDDVMDSAPMRRGVPSAHEVWGNSVAILTGDLILARASQMMSRLGEEGFRVQARTFERLVLGQLHESVGPQEHDDPKDHYLSVIADKTGSLVAAASRLGAHYGGCDPRTTDLLETYGEAVGVAFQLADDVIDLTADEASSGKTPGTDLREGVPTLPVLLLREAAAAGDQQAVAALQLVDGDLSSDEALAAAVEAVVAHPVTEKSWEVARAWAARGKEALSSLPDSTVKSALAAFADAVADRDR